MRKYDFVRLVSKKTGFTIANTTKAFDAIVESIRDAIIDNEEVVLENVGKISGVVVPEHEKKSFGEVKVVPEKTVVKFKASEKLKNELRKGTATKSEAPAK